MKALLNTLTALTLGALALTAQAEALKVMTSGGFTAAYKLLGPQYARQSGDTLETLLGPSMGKAPEAIPNRLARGEQADVVIMVGYALDELIKQINVEMDPAKRLELGDQAAKSIWESVHTLPLYQRPELAATDAKLANYGAFGLGSPKWADVGFMK